jgi:tetratricopeptide (TPR) repeat protein
MSWRSVLVAAVLLGLSGDACAAEPPAIDSPPAVAAGPRAALLEKALRAESERRWTAALATYDQALALRSDDVETLVKRGSLRLRLSDGVGALSDAAQALKLEPGSADAQALQKRVDGRRYGLADLYYNSGYDALTLRRYDAALAQFDKALIMRPDLIDARVSLAATLDFMGDDERAQVELDHALQLQPNNTGALINRGVVRRKLDDFAGSRADLERALALRPRDSRALVNYGITLTALYELDAALAALDLAITIAPRDAIAYVDRAGAWYTKGEFARADADFAQAILLKPNFEAAYQARGWAELIAGDRRLAMADFDQALQQSPGDGRAWLERGLAYAAADDAPHADADFDAALRTAETQIARHPGVAGPLLSRCGLRARMGRDLQGAIADCNQALTLRPAAENAVLWRALAELRLEDCTAAVRDADAAVSMRKDPFALYIRGVCRLRAGQTAAGEADIEAAKTIEPPIDKVYALWRVRP